MANDDLGLVNHALKELARLQLEGALAPETAWTQRHAMLMSVDEQWSRLAEEDEPLPSSSSDDAAPARAPVPWVALWASPWRRWRSLLRRRSRQAVRGGWQQGAWVIVLLGVATFIYVLTL